MKIKMTKKLVLKALNEMPATRLISGSWADGAYENTYTSLLRSFEVKNCNFCAVGAVLYGTLDKRNNTVRDLESAAGQACNPYNLEGFNQDKTLYVSMKHLPEVDYNKSLKRELENKNYMNALMYFFEREWAMARSRVGGLEPSRHQKLRVKNKLLNFVSKSFPSSFVVDINGAKPDSNIEIA